MFVVTVTFTAKPEFAAQFSKALITQAKNSLEHEVNCSRFDVCVGEDATRFFLYELYTNKAAFQHHLTTPHFLSFNDLVGPWTASKEVNTWQLAE